MRNAILLHGLPSKEEYYNPDRPSSSNSHWFPWLQNYLVKELPNAKVRTFHEYGHFTQRTLKDNKFPELLDACL